MNTPIVVGILALFLNGCSSVQKPTQIAPKSNESTYIQPDAVVDPPAGPYVGVTITGEVRESKAGLVVSGTLIDDTIDASEKYIGKTVQVKGTYHANMCRERTSEKLPVQCFDGPYLTDVVSIKIINDTPPEKVEADYAAWQLAKKELDKVQVIIGYDVNEYLYGHSAAIGLRDYYKYDEALQAVDYMPIVYPKIVKAWAEIQPQKDFPEIAEIKTLYKEMLELEKISGEYLRKNIVAAKAGDAVAKRTNEDLYTKYYQDAMAKNRQMMDVYAKVLTHGGDIEGKKLLKDNLPAKK